MCRQAALADGAIAARIGIAQRGNDPAAVYSDVAALVRRRAATAQRYLNRLDTLTVPDDDRDRLKSWLADRRRQQDLTLQLAAAFVAQSDTRISTLSQEIDALASQNAAFATRYGLPECAKGAT
ncbi:hypothetical protein [Paraconexibacter sp. AEG42_29]|uniref:hypothetical protein n=1 Tax=Paraconexibacter sp. AEG42_29 TaxID=2997339 RepID=UPI00339D6C18